MINIDVINTIIKFIALNICTFFTFFKIINFKSNLINKFIGIMSSILIAFFYSMMVVYIENIIILVISYILFSFVISLIIKEKIYYCITVMTISIAVNMIINIISAVITKTCIVFTGINIDDRNPINFILIQMLYGLLIAYFTKIKRFKNGFSFLTNVENKKNIDTVGLLFCCCLLGIQFLSNKENDTLFNTYLFIGLLIIGISIIKWIQDRIILNHNIKMSIKTIEEQRNIIMEKEKEIKKISLDLFNSAKIIHKYNNRLSALEFSIRNRFDVDTEFATDYSDILDNINNISKELTSEVKDNMKDNQELQKTGILGIDNIFKYMACEAKQKNIEFNLKINPSINYMIENIIAQSKLETIIGDVIRNSIIAIDSSQNKYKNILVILGLIDDYYSLCICDSGINFEIDTLVNLGIKPSTTHAKNGGSGIGYLTIFEVLNEYRASLIIEEKKLSNKVYTKSITIQFDGKNEYKIYSYRSKEINFKIKNKRIIIKDI